MFTIRAYNWATKATAAFEANSLAEAERLAYGLGHQTRSVGFRRIAKRAKPEVEVAIFFGNANTKITEVARFVSGHRVRDAAHLRLLRSLMPVAQAEAAPKRTKRGKKAPAKSRVAAERKAGPVNEPARPRAEVLADLASI